MPLTASVLRYVFVESTPGLKSTVLELPEVCKTGNGIKAKQSPDVQARVAFTELPGRGTACMRSPRRLHSPQVRFIPSHAPSASVAAHAGEPTLACFAELALHQDRHLVWSVAPLLKRELTPPRSHWEALGVHHPPPTSLVLAHGLTISAEAPDAWPYPEDPAELVMGAIWATLNERWHTIPPDLRARLSTAPLLL